MLAELSGSAAELSALRDGSRAAVAALAADYLEPSPDAAPTLRTLESLGIPLALVTTASAEAAGQMAASVGFRGSVVSGDDGPPLAGQAAPNLRALPTAVGVPYEQMHYVGADPRRDLEPARRAGMQTVRLVGHVRDPGEDSSATLVIQRLPEVLELVREPYTRSLLGLRYILHSVAGWRPGHFLVGVEYSRESPDP